MNSFLKKVFFYAGIVLFYFALTSAYNYYFDPYGILQNRKTFEGIRPNERSLKVHHIVQNPNTFNSFLFSNSKGGALHFNQLNNETQKWYNMTYSLGTPEEFYTDLQLFLEKNISIKNVVIGLDEGAIYERASSHKNQASRKFVAMKEQSINWEYMFLPISIKKLFRRDLSKKHIVHDIYENGNYYEKNAFSATCGGLEDLKLIPYTSAKIKTRIQLNSTIEVFQKINVLCKKNNIDLTFLVHPCSYDNYMSATEKRLQFRRLLRIMRDKGLDLFHPFKEHVIENNPCYWLDNHHYAKKVGDSILQMYSTHKR